MNARAPMSRPWLGDRHHTVTWVASFDLPGIIIDAVPAVYELTVDHEGGLSARLCWMHFGRMTMNRKQLCHAFGEADVLANEDAAERWAVDQGYQLREDA